MNVCQLQNVFMLMWNKNIFIPYVRICQTTWQLLLSPEFQFYAPRQQDAVCGKKWIKILVPHGAFIKWTRAGKMKSTHQKKMKIFSYNENLNVIFWSILLRDIPTTMGTRPLTLADTWFETICIQCRRTYLL